MTRTVRASGGLSGFVDAIWFAGPESRGGGDELALPTGDVDLVFELSGDRVPVVIGPSNRARTLSPDPRPVVGATFKVGRAAALLGVPVHELRDAVVALSEFWGADAEATYDRAATATTPSAALSALHDAMASRLARSGRWPHPVAARAAAALREVSGGPARINTLATSLGLSERRLEQVFRADVGLAPKTYQRLHRFRRALIDIDRATGVGWSRFAGEHGYCDQSHFIDDFRAHCGVTPVSYLRVRGPALNHLPLED